MSDRPIVEPYDFVPLGDGPQRQRQEPTCHDQYHARHHSGQLACRLTAHTPLFIYDPRFVRRVDQGHETVDFPVFNGEAVIPGTSLKGVIRSVVEAVASGCFTLPLDWRNGKRIYRGSGITHGKTLEVRLPREFEHCPDKQRLCLTCRLFGSLDPRGKWAYTGKVAIGDARAARDHYTLMPYHTLDVLSTPKPEGRPGAYRAPNREIRGRKFYRHRVPPDVLERAPDRTGRPRRDGQNKTVQPVQQGAIFTFQVEYNDLTDDELRWLLYGLVLEEGLWHKIGLGKPIGLGSAQIEIVEWTQVDRTARYRVWGEGVKAPLTGEILDAELNNWLRPCRESQTEPIRKLRDILRPDPTVDVRYPPQASPRGQRERK